MFSALPIKQVLFENGLVRACRVKLFQPAKSKGVLNPSGGVMQEEV